MTDKRPDWVEIDAFLLTLPSLSRPLIDRHFRSDFSVEQKADNSPVTIADKSVETELRQAILARFLIMRLLAKNKVVLQTGKSAG